MNHPPTLTLVAQAQEYFKELVTQALEKQKLYTQPETEVYLVNLLNGFMTTERLYPQTSEGSYSQPPLVVMVKEAIEQPQPQIQSSLFRHIGDVSLYVAGFFQASLNRKLVDVDYYIEMGGAAYLQVATLVEEHFLKLLYQELAEKFSGLVDVFAEVSDQTTQKSEKDLLRLYELWVRTRSSWAARALKNAGILPNATIKKDLQ